MILAAIYPAYAALEVQTESDGKLVLTGSNADPEGMVALIVLKNELRRTYFDQTRADEEGQFYFRISLPAGSYEAKVFGEKGFSESLLIESSPPEGNDGGEDDNGGSLPTGGGTAFLSVKGDARTGMILSRQAWSWEGAAPTVTDVLKNVLDQKGISYSISPEGYVSSIAGLAEKQPGYPLSGWLYTVNGEFHADSASNHQVSDGDDIQWLYTLDGGKDVGNPYEITLPWLNIDQMELRAQAQEILRHLEELLDQLDQGIYKLNSNAAMSSEECQSVKEVLNEQVFLKETVSGADNLLIDPRLEMILHLPEGCLINPLHISVREIPPSEEQYTQELVSEVYYIDPEAVPLQQPATVAVRVGPSTGQSWESLRPARFDRIHQTWEPLPGVTDPRQGWVAFRIGSFGQYAVISAPELPETASVSKIAGSEVLDVLRQKGIMVGTDQGMELDRPVKRSEISWMLYGLMGKPGADGRQLFADVSSDQWFAAAVNFLAKKKIITGYPEGQFLPEAEVTRCQMACLLDRYLQMQGFSPPIMRDYPLQEPVPDWAEPSVQNVMNSGLVNWGISEPFDGNKPVSREEAAYIIYQLLQLPAEKISDIYGRDGVQ